MQQQRTRWYTVRRTYRVEDLVYVEASSAAEAKAKVEGHDYEHVTGGDAISATRLGRVKPIATENLPYDVRYYAEHGMFPS